MTIKFEKVREAFFFGSPMLNEAVDVYLSKQTGELIYGPEMSLWDGEDHEVPDDIDDEEKYVAVPNQWDLGLGKPLALKFTEQFLPDDLRKVGDIFSRSDAFPRFRDLLEYRDAVQQWRDFEEKATAQALREWCEEHDISLED